MAFDTTEKQAQARTALPEISIIICTLNEAPNLRTIFPRIPDFVTEVVLVDGHSTDRTVEIAQELRQDVLVIQQTSPGKDSALRTGVQEANGDIVVTLDCAKVPRRTRSCSSNLY